MSRASPPGRRHEAEEVCGTLQTGVHLKETVNHMEFHVVGLCGSTKNHYRFFKDMVIERTLV